MDEQETDKYRWLLDGSWKVTIECMSCTLLRRLSALN
jgi:hypothetical protein